MPNMNPLTLKVSQATDTNVFSDNFSSTKKDSSVLFSNLMDKNRDHQQSGKSITKNGNEEPSHFNLDGKVPNKSNISTGKSNVENNSTVDSQIEKSIDNTINNETKVLKEDTLNDNSNIEYNDKLDTQVKDTDSTINNKTVVSAEDIFSDKSNVEYSDKLNSQMEETDSKVNNKTVVSKEDIVNAKNNVENNNTLDSQVEKNTDNKTVVSKEDDTKESVEISGEASSELLIESSLPNNTLTNNPEQLLSFLSASDKVLNSNKNNSSIQEDSIALDPKEETDVDLKSGKTLVAQSVTAQVNNEESSITKKVNELLKSQDVESTKASNINTVEVKNEQSLTKNNLLNEFVASDKKLTSEDKKLTSENKKLAMEKSIESKLDNKTARTEIIQEVNLTDDSETASELNEKALQPAVAQINKDVKLTEVSDKKTSTDTKVTTEDTNTVDKVIEQSILQSTSETVEQIESEEVVQVKDKNAEFKADIKSLSSLQASVAQKSLEVTEPEHFHEQIKNVSANNIAPNRSGQIMEKGNKSSQDQALNKVSEKNIENTEDVTELATEKVKDELLNTELKAVNNKINQNIAPVLDTLTQREVNSRIGGETYMEDELSFENVMQTMSSDLSKAQKNTVIQHAETISIMRKDFTDAVKDKVMVMINQKIQQVDIQLDPPELGNMQVRINMQNEQAVVSFVVQNQQAKEALDQNMDRLKQMMSESGVDVGESNVKQESNQSSMQEGEQQAGNTSVNNNEDGTLEGSMHMEHTKVLKASSTGVDYYV